MSTSLHQTVTKNESMSRHLKVWSVDACTINHSRILQEGMFYLGSNPVEVCFDVAP